MDIASDSCELNAKEVQYRESDERNEECELSFNLSRNSAVSASVESLNTLLMSLPEISIPSPIYNPLPLQCLAASALPDVIKRDIEEVIAEVAQTPDEGRNAVALEEIHSNEETGFQSDNKVISVILKKAEFQEEEHSNGLDMGLKITGGVKCDVCSCLHAVVTKVSSEVESLKEIKEGMCAVEWCGKTLEGCSFEEVRRILNDSRNSNYNKVEITFKKCSNNLISFRRPNSSPKHLTRAVGIRFNRNRYKLMDVSNDEPETSTTLEVSIETNGQSSNIQPLQSITSHDNKATQQDTSTSHPSKNNSGFQVRKSGRNIFNIHKSQPNLFGSKRPQRATFHSQQSLPDTLDVEEQQQRPASLALLHGPAPKSYPSTSPVYGGSGAVQAHNGITKSNSTPLVHSVAGALRGRAKSPVPPHVQMNGVQDINVAVGGLIQLGLKYDSNFEDLKITLKNVKGQSSQEINDTSNVFLSTYLIPDTRKQGTRNIKVKQHDDVTHDSSTSYIINEQELTNVALRVVLWDTSRSKNIIFRGEVLLGLSDHDIVNLSGEPTWYTVCPEDPNLPKLSRPTMAHGKQKGVASVEHLLQRFKHNLSTLKQHTFKSSSSNPNLSSPNNLGPIMRRNMSLSKKELRRSKKSLSGSYSPQAMFDMLETEIENACGSNPSLEEVREQLSTILKVLREAEINEKEIENEAEANKKSKLSGILKVLGHSSSDDTQPTESSLHNVPSTNGGALDAEMMHTSDDGTYSTLDYRVRKRNHLTSKESTRPRSDSFKVIPDLRDSLGAGEGKGDKVTVYSFLEEIENSFSQRDNQTHINEIEPATHTTTTDEEHHHFVSNPSISVESQAHYKIVDSFQSEDELDSPTKGGQTVHTGKIGAKSLDHGIYPAEVSLHRISIVDVDKKNELEHKSKKSLTLPNTQKATMPNSQALNSSRHEPPKPKRRPRSVGDLDDLDDEEEILLVRPPLRSHATIQEGSIDYLSSIGPLNEVHTTVVELEDDEVDGEVFSSLDFAQRQAANSRTSFVKVEEECDCTETSLDFAVRSRVTSDGVHSGDDALTSLDIAECSGSSLAESGSTSLHHPDSYKRSETVHLNVGRQTSLVPVNKPEKPEKKSGIAKWRSLDNLLGGSQPTKKPKTKKRTRKNSFMTPPPAAHTNISKTNSLSESGSRAAGKIKLELQFNTLNPLHPVLIVKMIDVVFQSPKLFSSDLCMKGYLYHSSTGVCVLKNKTVVNVKNPFPSAPMGILQFKTDITNLRLQVCIYTNGKLFSKKTVGEVCLDLNSLDLQMDRPFNKWLELTKAAIN